MFLTQVDDQEAEKEEEEDEEESEPDILSYTASTVHIPDKYKVSRKWGKICPTIRFKG